MTGNNQNIKLAKVRELDDFILSSARFQIPPYNDLQKWNDRIISNLLYYQTNYFILIGIVFLLIGLIKPKEMLIGFLGFSIAFAVFAYATSQLPNAISFKKNHPLLSLLLILGAGYLVVSLFSSVLVFIFGIAFPLLVMFMHASTRLRSLKNKLGEKFEAVGFKTTPMGHVLRAMGIEIELIKD